MEVTNDFYQSCLDEKGTLILSGLVQHLIDTSHFASAKGRLRHYDDHLGCWMDVTDENPNISIHNYIPDDCRRMVNARVMKHVVHDLIASPELAVKLNEDPYSLNVLNGIVDLRTGKCILMIRDTVFPIVANFPMMRMQARPISRTLQNIFRLP